MGAKENKALVRRAWKSAVKGDLKAVEEIYAKDAVWHQPGGDDLKGIEQIRTFLNEWYEGFTDRNVEIHELLAEGDFVASRVTLGGKHSGTFQGVAPTNKTVRIGSISMNRIKDGKIVEDWDEMDLLGLMQQLGVIPAEGAQQAAPA